MGSGYFMNAYVLSLARNLFDLTDFDLHDPTYYLRTGTELDDYKTRSREAAERVAKAAREHNPDYARIDVVEGHDDFKVAFFK